MPIQNPEAPQVLREEILAEARRESAAIIARAQEESQALLAEAAAVAAKLRQERLAQARTEAARQTTSILATVPVEAGRLRSARVEALLESVGAAVRQQLESRQGINYREVLVRLSAEAAAHMAGEAFIVKLSPADRAAFGAGLSEDIARCNGRLPAGFTLAQDAEFTGWGVIIEDREGRQVWDNRLGARLQRLWPELRRQIAVQTALAATREITGGTA